MIENLFTILICEAIVGGIILLGGAVLMILALISNFIKDIVDDNENKKR